MKTRLGIVFVCMILIVLAGCSAASQSNDKFQYAPGKGPGSDSKGSSTTLAASTTLGSSAATTTKPAATTLPPTTTLPSNVDKSTLPRKEFNEGDIVSFPNLAKKDADGDPIAYTFSAPLDSQGKWQTKEGDAGEYITTITASDGKTQVQQQVLVVIKSINKAPVIEPIADMTVNEGDIIVLNAKAQDPEGAPVTITYSGWMNSSRYQTDFNDAGVHTVTVTASDGKLQSKIDVQITVTNVDRAPIIKSVDDKVVTEGDSVSIATTAADPDGDRINISYPPPFDSSGTWKTKEGDAGDNTYTITASDGKLSDSTKVSVKVLAKNKPPVLTIKNKDIVVSETDTVTIDASATDPDGDPVTITYSGWMTTNTKQTGYDDSGNYTVTVTASDGKKSVSDTVHIEVLDKNRPPVIIL